MNTPFMAHSSLFSFDTVVVSILNSSLYGLELQLPSAGTL